MKTPQYTLERKPSWADEMSIFDSFYKVSSDNKSQSGGGGSALSRSNSLKLPNGGKIDVVVAAGAAAAAAGAVASDPALKYSTATALMIANKEANTMRTSEPL